MESLQSLNWHLANIPFSVPSRPLLVSSSIDEFTLLKISTNSLTFVKAEFEFTLAKIDAAEDVVELSLNS